MWCIKYHNKNNLGQAFFRPWNSVRDGKSYSLRYIPTSFIDGIKKDYEIKSEIIRHKLKFSKNVDNSDQIKFNTVSRQKDGSKYDERKSIYVRHVLSNVELILGFDNEEDAINMSKTPIYLGQMEFQAYPDLKDGNFVFELSDEEFSELKGVETFPADENGIFIGFNRNKGNEKMYIDIDRKEW